ncbi:NAD(P)H-dependent oxidoreductase (plasmid) [Clostridium estertheticum]|uniref:NAD(P)H-dependent oxidoreductase n=1 Tax=Clostridium estertheticum TaxID=238834 RepID=UPI001C0B0289|nr:NAD(P)H-dependent oxidoreductase [Clostridium estertheticum]MBU3217860.1 NAD(P)H-dependent oxidoreductase [Clostridium estertheticum]WAG58379.1 NAD(P)H-dependent oxidoreductase [Clostridium estertheticum]
MNNLVIFAHPNQKSFGKGIVDAVVKASEKKGANVRVRDLYEIGFDPLLKPLDFTDFQSGKIPEDIAVEQEHIKWADVITFIYPVWWTSFPAMLKGYVDRVFSYGFAYEYVDGVPNGLLKIKKGLLFCTTGTPSEIYAGNGMHNSMKQTTDEGIFNFSGIKEVKHTFFGAVPTATDEAREAYLKEVTKIVEETL